MFSFSTSSIIFFSFVQSKTRTEKCFFFFCRRVSDSLSVGRRHSFVTDINVQLISVATFTKFSQTAFVPCRTHHLNIEVEQHSAGIVLDVSLLGDVSPADMGLNLIVLCDA